MEVGASNSHINQSAPILEYRYNTSSFLAIATTYLLQGNFFLGWQLLLALSSQ